jgi:NAD(P)-dependent dehydrogenase (short-subunit alcohol dehydrogenase family)
MGQFSTRPPHRPLAVRAATLSNVHAGKGFLVTGAAGGVGRATAELLAAQGARIVLADIRVDALEAAVAAASKTNAFPVALDASNPSSIAEAVSYAESRLGRIGTGFSA